MQVTDYGAWTVFVLDDVIGILVPGTSTVKEYVVDGNVVPVRNCIYYNNSKYVSCLKPMTLTEHLSFGFGVPDFLPFRTFKGL